MMHPALLRKRHRNAPIRFFLHTPFPSSALLRRLPWRAQLIEGLLGADVVAFHTTEYRDHFLRSCWRSRDDVVVEGTTVTAPDGRRVRAEVHPISIDARDYAERTSRDGVERYL